MVRQNPLPTMQRKKGEKKTGVQNSSY
jgi:hypothetical protein